MNIAWKLWSLPIASILVSAPAWGLPASQVAQVSKAVTVEIKTANSIGSGVLVAKHPQGYTVLTAAHVVRDAPTYQLIAPDGRSYAIDRPKIKILPGADLALVSFASSQSYRTVKVRQANAIAEGSTVYVGGFPLTTQSISKPLFNFTEGRVTASSKQPLRDGYGLVYTNLTLPGMSGGSVLNDRGELIAIHGRGDVEKSTEASTINANVRVKTGFNLGILASVFVPLATQNGVQLEVTTANIKTNDLGSDAFVSAAVKFQSGDLPGALAELNRSIVADPNKAAAYYLRANIYQTLGDRSQVLADLNRAIELDPKNASAYYLRGNIAYANQDYRRAAADFDRTTALEPKYIQAYLMLAITAQVQGDLPGAKAAYSKMIAKIYRERKEWQLALNDYASIVKINPNDRDAYSKQLEIYRQLQDNRGIIKTLDRFVQLEPNRADYLADRARAKLELKERAGAIADFRSAIALYRKQGDNSAVERLTEELRKLTGQQ